MSAWGSIGNSNYHALAASYKIRTNSLTADFNYTWSHSLDDSSGLQTGGGYNGESFILNPFRQHDMYSNSDFDSRQQINANTVWQLPFGHGKSLLANVGKVANGIIGGWQLTGIFRFNTGMPVGFYNGTTGVFDDARWATNWEVQSNAVRTTNFNACPTKDPLGTPKLFGCNTVFRVSALPQRLPRRNRRTQCLPSARIRRGRPGTRQDIPPQRTLGQDS